MIRTAPNPEGPWSDEIVAFQALQPASGNVYDAHAHSEYDVNGGQILFVSYSRATGEFTSEVRLVSIELKPPRCPDAASAFLARAFFRHAGTKRLNCFVPSSAGNMATPEQDCYWMQRALELARRGIAVTSPNPAVGCVILDRAGQVIGEGWHEYDLVDHAEVIALRVASQHATSYGLDNRLYGGTAYVTLEPCNHIGRTGPCTQALIAAGLGRVVAATIDPNPNVAGHGMERLRAAGIETTVGVCQAEARRINEGFARWSQHKRPLVLMKVAMTLDGRIAPPAGQHPAREPYWITCDAARQAVQPLRWKADAALTGVDTVLADDPMLTDRSGLRRRRPLLRVVLDSALRMPLDSKMVLTASQDVVVFTVSKDEAKLRALRERGVRVEVLQAEAPAPGERTSAANLQAGRAPLGKVLDMLGEEGVLTLLTETGTRLNTALLAGGLVDRVQLFVSSQIMGSDAVPAFRGMANPIRMADVEVERYENDLGLCSLLRDPWPRVSSQ
jgi:diaminohydroxyphosphoribosylaminopyrimidine deaminase / 5-amino-6-(5-phosphoribosylamino)uracil reductase